MPQGFRGYGPAVRASAADGGEVFDNGGTVFDPVAGVAVGDSIDFDVLRCVDMAADDSVASTMAGVANNLIAIVADMSCNGTQTLLHPGHE